MKHFSDEKVCEYLLDEEPMTTLDEAVELVNQYTNPEEKNFNSGICQTSCRVIPKYV